MDFVQETAHLMSLASLILIIIMQTNKNFCFLEDSFFADEDKDSVQVVRNVAGEGSSAMGIPVSTHATLHHYRLFNTLASIDEDLGFWVEPRPTTWFTQFLLHEYDDARWIQMFRMTKRSVISLSQLLSPAVKKKDTRYQAAVPVTVPVACTLFKLSHGATLLICSELFALGRSTISGILRQVVHAINDGLRNEIRWPFGEGIGETVDGFNNLCGLPGIMGAIDRTHFTIRKPRYGSSDYFYFKSASYTITCQAVVDSSKKFLDLYVGLPGSTNDSRVLRPSTLFHRGQKNTLWEGNHSFSRFSPSLLGDSGYPLLPWLMVPHRRARQMAVADALFNRKLNRGRAVVENAFALLKQTIRELHQKTELHVAFIPDVVTCCAILHNVLLNESHKDVERLMDILHREGPHPSADVFEEPPEEVVDRVPDDDDNEANLKRRNLGLFLTLQRMGPA